MAHQHCYCAGSHEPGCPNANDPNGMPPLTPDDGDED